MKERAIKLLECQFKEISNAKRIKILLLLDEHPGLTVNEIAAQNKNNMKTISEHLRRLSIAGIVIKKNNGRCVNHYLTESGEKMLKIINNF